MIWRIVRLKCERLTNFVDVLFCVYVCAHTRAPTRLRGTVFFH
jgi:hypothetical protein